MRQNSLPAIYTPPASDNGIALAAEVLAIAQASPEHAATLSRVACVLLGGPAGTSSATDMPAPQKPARAKAAKPSRVPAQLPAPIVAKATIGGIEVCTDADSESVTYAGKTMEVSRDQAQFTLLLVRAMPSPVGRDFLEKKLFPGRSGEGARVGVNGIIGPTRAALAGIGLDVHTVRGIGVVLRPLERA